MKSFIKEQKIFNEIKEKFSNIKYQQNIDEFKLLIKKLFLNYDPAINENKFITGHVAEILFALLLKSFNFKVKIKGSNNDGYDLEINDLNFSLKTLSKPKSSIRLKNIHGTNNEYNLNYSTIVIELGTGIYYFDPNNIKELNIVFKKSSDGFDINWKDVNKVINTYNTKIEINNFPSKKELYIENDFLRKTASQDVCNNLLENYSKILNKYL